MTGRPRALLILGSALLAAGCAPQGEFPSLAPRPAERDVSTEPPVRAPVPVAVNADLRARIEALVGQSADGDAAFASALAGTRSVVERAGGRQSESWVQAQLALSRLEATRAPTTMALADLDALRSARAAMPTNAEDFALLGAGIDRVSGVARAQQEALDGLRRRLGD